VLLPDVRTHVARGSLRVVEGGWTWKFDPEFFGSRLRLRDLLPDLRCPGVLLRCEHGPVSPLMAQDMATLVPGRCRRSTSPTPATTRCRTSRWPWWPRCAPCWPSGPTGTPFRQGEPAGPERRIPRRKLPTLLEVPVRTLSSPASLRPHVPLTRVAAGLSAGVLALALSACGGSDAGSGSSAAVSSATSSAAAGSSSPEATGTTVTADEADFSITLSRSSLSAGTYTFEVKNTGHATHSLTIEGPGGVDMTSDKVQAGQSTTMTVTLQSGRYQVYCPIGNHRAMGMDTTLTVS
jgi:uncharacterized cupredoxin-like copper-binding protein